MKRIALADIEMAYVDRGSGRPLVLVHGFPLDHRMWSAQIDALSTHCRVIAPDLRGFGRTPLGDVDQTTGVSMERYADDLAGLLDGLGISGDVVLAGFSMGGYVAWQFMRKYGQRLRALVLCDTRATADTDEGRAARLTMAADVMASGSAFVADQMIPKLFAPRTLGARPEIVEATREVITGTSPAAIAAAGRGMAARPDVTAELSTIELPALVIVGEEDAITNPTEMRGIADALPRAELVEVPEAGHMAPVENAAVVGDAIAGFLDRLG